QPMIGDASAAGPAGGDTATVAPPVPRRISRQAKLFGGGGVATGSTRARAGTPASRNSRLRTAAISNIRTAPRLGMSFAPWTKVTVIACGGVDTATACGPGARLNGSDPPATAAA